MINPEHEAIGKMSWVVTDLCRFGDYPRNLVIGETGTYTYFVRNPQTGLMKVGKTVSLKQRFSQLRVQYGRQLLPYAAIAIGGTHEGERYFHKELSSFRIHGEWFDLTDGHVDQILETHCQVRLNVPDWLVVPASMIVAVDASGAMWFNCEAALNTWGMKGRVFNSMQDDIVDLITWRFFVPVSLVKPYLPKRYAERVESLEVETQALINEGVVVNVYNRTVQTFATRYGTILCSSDYKRDLYKELGIG